MTSIDNLSILGGVRKEIKTVAREKISCGEAVKVTSNL